MFKFFTDKETNQSIAINSNRVDYVRDHNLGTKIIFSDRSYLVVSDPYLETVARLNEKK
jgi:hypothetical protein